MEGDYDMRYNFNKIKQNKINTRNAELICNNI